MVNRLGPEPRLFLLRLRLQLIHLATSLFFKEEVACLVCSSEGLICTSARHPPWVLYREKVDDSHFFKLSKNLLSDHTAAVFVRQLICFWYSFVLEVFVFPHCVDIFSHVSTAIKNNFL